MSGKESWRQEKNGGFKEFVVDQLENPQLWEFGICVVFIGVLYFIWTQSQMSIDGTTTVQANSNTPEVHQPKESVTKENTTVTPSAKPVTETKNNSEDISNTNQDDFQDFENMTPRQPQIEKKPDNNTTEIANEDPTTNRKTPTEESSHQTPKVTNEVETTSNVPVEETLSNGDEEVTSDLEAKSTSQDTSTASQSEKQPITTNKEASEKKRIFYMRDFRRWCQGMENVVVLSKTTTPKPWLIKNRSREVSHVSFTNPEEKVEMQVVPYPDQDTAHAAVEDIVNVCDIDIVAAVLFHDRYVFLLSTELTSRDLDWWIDGFQAQFSHRYEGRLGSVANYPQQRNQIHQKRIAAKASLETDKSVEDLPKNESNTQNEQASSSDNNQENNTQNNPISEKKSNQENQDENTSDKVKVDEEDFQDFEEFE